MSSCDGFATRSTARRRGTPSSRRATAWATGWSLLQRSKTGDGSPTADLVNHVHVLVLPVRAGDPEQHREPADRTETPFLSELAPEDELFADPVEVPPGLLEDPVHVHLVTISDAWRKVHARAC